MSFTSLLYIHISLQECKQLLSNSYQRNPGDLLFDQ